MTETWVLWGAGWKLPIQVEWEGSADVAKVTLHPLIPWLSVWERAAEERLRGVAFSEAGAWFVFRARLEEVASKIEGTETTEGTEALVVWNLDRAPTPLPAGDMMLMGEKRAREAAETRAFLQWFVDCSGVKLFDRIEELEAFYYLLMGSGLTYMLETGKALPLVWGKVFASATRANWQSGMKAAIGHKRGVGTLPERVAKRLYAGYSRTMNAENKTEWLHPELVWNDAWRETVTAHESSQRSRVTQKAYLELCDNRIKKVMPLLLEAYLQYKKEVAHPTMAMVCPDLFVSVSSGRVIKRRPKQNLANRRKWAKLIRKHLRPRKPQQPPVVGAADANVPPVCDLRQEDGDMRDAGGNLSESGGED